MKFSTEQPIITDEKTIDDVLSRSIFQILPSNEVLKKELMSGRRLRIYIGADATGPQLHLGHSTNFILLEKLRALGHEVIVLFGDFTAMIGDPSGKESVRRALTEDEINDHVRTWKKQIAPILSFSDTKNPARIMRNSAWLSKLSFAEIIKLASSFTVQHMLERDMFERRLTLEQPVYLHEFLYPLMQGYDSVVMDVDVEIGGSDQIFNMLAGRTLQRKYNNKEKFIVATTLLEDQKTGKKLMSKSEGNFIALNDTPTDMYGKVMALPDEVIISVFIDCTLMSLSDIETIKQELKNGTNPRDIKMKLARELVSLYHGSKKAVSAERQFVETFQKKSFPDDAEEIKTTTGTLLATLLVQEKHVASNSEMRRLLHEGAIRNVRTGIKITEPEFKITETLYIKIGKRKFLKIRV